jgi:hypothetical protein
MSMGWCQVIKEPSNMTVMGHENYGGVNLHPDGTVTGWLTHDHEHQELGVVTFDDVCYRNARFELCASLPNTPPPVAVAAPLSGGPSKAAYDGRCRLSIDDHVYMLSDHCQINTDDDGSFQIRNGDKDNKYFAYANVIDRDDPSKAEISWNGVIGESHAHERLGVLVRNDGHESAMCFHTPWVKSYQPPTHYILVCADFPQDVIDANRKIQTAQAAQTQADQIAQAPNQFDYSWITDTVVPQLLLGSEIHDRVFSGSNSSCQTGFSQIEHTVNTIEKLRDTGLDHDTVFGSVDVFYPSLSYLQACRVEVGSICPIAADGSKLARDCAAYARSEPGVEELAIQNIPELKDVLRSD